MTEKKDYIGRIKNTGSQYVEAPYQPEKKRTGTVKKGNDLRNGGKNRK